MIPIRLLNSLSGKLEEFVPLKEGEVSIYVCGPTVYASPHIGNFRPPVVFDTLRRFLDYVGYKVTYVSNYTDVDDKIIGEAEKLGISEQTLTEGVIKEYREISDSMSILEPDYTPTPTKYMGKIISYIEDLVEKGYAYVSGDDVYFRVRKIDGYGVLSGNSIEALEEGARIEISEKKEDPLDFTLWKKTEKGIAWDSPWSRGRPGWHSECCVMIDSLFREQNGYIDIHGGGFDLKFPHHDNEIAQSIAHNGNRLAKYFVHNGFINMGQEKMSKSLGNIMLAKDVVKEYGGLAFRLCLLSSHYRAPVAYGEEPMKEAKRKMDSLTQTSSKASVALQLKGIDPYLDREIEEGEFLKHLADDLNTPNALSVLYAEQKEVNQLLRRGGPEDLARAYYRYYRHLEVLGLSSGKKILTEGDRILLGEYQKAREERDFARSDVLRAELTKKGLL